MPSTQKLIVISFALVAGIGFGFLLSQIITTEAPAPIVESPTVPVVANHTALKEALLPLLETRFGATPAGYNSHKLLYVYKGMHAEDFDGVETISGHYEFKDGYLWHVSSSSDESAEDITDAGFVTLSKNIHTRLAPTANISAEALVLQLEKPTESAPTTVPPAPVPSDGDTPVQSPDDTVMCTMDAKMCSDGSFVGRVAPSCAFAPCPDEVPPSSGEIVCTSEQREAEACIEIYAPVCASYQVQCITTPCNPVPKSYPNSCFACADNNVISYTEGECAVPTTE